MMQEVTKNVRMQISEGRLQAEAWYQKLDEDARMQYRMSARSLFHGLMTYVATNGVDAENEAYAIGYEYASRAHRYSLNYVDAVRAFLFLLLLSHVVSKESWGIRFTRQSKVKRVQDRLLILAGS